MSKKVLFLMVVSMVASVLAGCSDDAGEQYRSGQTLPQQAGRALITNAVPQTAAAPAEENLLQQIQRDFAAGAANVASGGQSAQAPATYSQLATGETVKAFNGSVCLKSEAQHTGKVYICPQSVELCSKQGKSISVDEYGFAACK